MDLLLRWISSKALKARITKGHTNFLGKKRWNTFLRCPQIDPGASEPTPQHLILSMSDYDKIKY